MQEQKNDLLIFAHRGEADAFIKYFQAKMLPFAVTGLYEGNDVLLLITGEGDVAVLQSLSAVLGAYGSDVRHIYNLGIAGALREGLAKGQICPIRTFYAAQGEKMRFRSFSTGNSDSIVDCVSADRRIEDPQSATMLSHFADLVDREGWFAASVASLFSIPFFAAKLISDDARSPVDPADLSIHVKKWSADLLRWYLQQSGHATANSAAETVLSLPDGFYATVAQRRRLRSLIRQLRQKKGQKAAGLADFVDLHDIGQMSGNPKKRTAFLIEALERIANPMRHHFKEAVEQQIAPLRAAGIDVRIDPNLEDSGVELRFKAANEARYQQLQNTLAEFDFAALQQVFDGAEEAGE